MVKILKIGVLQAGTKERVLSKQFAMACKVSLDFRTFCFNVTAFLTVLILHRSC
jgi:hypothetical protein